MLCDSDGLGHMPCLDTLGLITKPVCRLQISLNQAVVLKTRVLMEDPQIMQPFQAAKAAQTKGGTQKEPPLLGLMGTLVSLANEDEDEDEEDGLEGFLPAEEQGHHEVWRRASPSE